MAVEPSETVDIEVGNVQWCFPINDEYANTNKDQCAAVLNSAAVYYVENKFDFGATPIKHAGCNADFSVSIGCSCCTYPTHFSVYSVIDEEANSDIKAQETSKLTSNANGVDTAAGTTAVDAAAAIDGTSDTTSDSSADGSSGGNVAIIAGGVAGALLVVLAVALVIRHKRAKASEEGGSQQKADDAVTQEEDQDGYTSNPMRTMSQASTMEEHKGVEEEDDGKSDEV